VRDEVDLAAGIGLADRGLGAALGSVVLEVAGVVAARLVAKVPLARVALLASGLFDDSVAAEDRCH